MSLDPGKGLGNGDKLTLSCKTAMKVIRPPNTNNAIPSQNKISGNKIAIDFTSKTNATKSKN